MVFLNKSATVVLPDRDVPLGVFGPGDRIVARERQTPKGLTLPACSSSTSGLRRPIVHSRLDAARVPVFGTFPRVAGRLVRVLPAWRGQCGIVHLVFTTRRGLPPAVRALIDHLAANFPREVTTG